jgi:hypothetical protein
MGHETIFSTSSFSFIFTPTSKVKMTAEINAENIQGVDQTNSSE